MSELEIIRELKNYNPEAQRYIYKKYYKLFISISNRYVVDKEFSKDLVQDTFIKIFFNINKFKEEGSFEGWMKRILVNDALSYLRKKNKIQTTSIEDILEGNVEDDQEDELHEIPTKEVLMEAIESLPDHYREVFNMVCIENYSHKEVSHMLQISETNSRIILLKARKKLKKYLTNTLKVEV